MANMNLDKKDVELLKEKGISLEQIESQINMFKRGFPYLPIEKAATIGDGIHQLTTTEINSYINQYNEQKDHLTIEKFVPASGAASRMFKKLFTFIQENEKEDGIKGIENIKPLIDHIDRFAFYRQLKEIIEKQEDITPEALIEKKRYVDLIWYIVDEKGLNYGNLPKALIEFHSYENETRTSLEEHLVEGALYARFQQKHVNIHFTVSPEHLELFRQKIKDTAGKYERRYQVKYDIAYSVQRPSTDTVAVDMDNHPFRLDDGTVLFRPGGHGALIQNLNSIDADVIFIKNIDNVVPDKIKGETVKYKSVLAGYLLNIKETIFHYIQLIDKKSGEHKIDEIESFMRKRLFIRFPNRYQGWTDSKKLDYLRNKLDRPIRVCGMVKNEGEPGGGPFLAENRDGSVSPQILESSQINMDDPQQQHEFEMATHFNPVDIVCTTKNHEGKLFDLQKYIDPNTGFISRKSKDGRDLKALELPGLWNGAMADWNTVFIEVPIITFNPVKTVIDLLRKEHQ